jgi:hypothetical protein
MIVIYGNDTTRRATHELNVTCPNCQSKGTTQVDVNVRFVHIFWIPIYPKGKIGFTRCRACNMQSDTDNMTLPYEFRKEFNKVSSGYKAPIWLYLGISMILLLFSSILLVGLMAIFGNKKDESTLPKVDKQALAEQAAQDQKIRKKYMPKRLSDKDFGREIVTETVYPLNGGQAEETELYSLLIPKEMERLKDKYRYNNKSENTSLSIKDVNKREFLQNSTYNIRISPLQNHLNFVGMSQYAPNKSIILKPKGYKMEIMEVDVPKSKDKEATTFFMAFVEGKQYYCLITYSSPLALKTEHRPTFMKIARSFKILF